MTTLPLLSMNAISKSFPGARALSEVDFAVDGGEVVSLCGENGAGKSTLMSVMGGIYLPDAGLVSIAGQRVRIVNPGVAETLGIGYVHQEPTLVPSMTVTANIFLNRERVRGRVLLDFKKMRFESVRLMQMLGFDIDPDQTVQSLTLVEKEAVEIAKAMLLDPRILILDEVTAPLDSDAVEHLFEIVNALKAKGIAIIFISHRLDEVIRISDRIVVLRDGRNAGELRGGGEVTHKDVISLMLGEKGMASLMFRDTAPDMPTPRSETVSLDDVALSVCGLSKTPYFENVEFTLYRGEILGFAGLKGSGTTELLKTLFGVLRRDAGRLLVGDREIVIRSPRDAIKSGIGMLTNDRQREGLALRRPVEENVTISSLDRIANGVMLLRPAALERLADAMTKRLSIKTPSLRQEVINLSGGNQQKVVLAKWLLRDLDVVIADEPTRGVDVQAKDEIHKLLLALKGDKKALLVYSPEVPELLAICDRIFVFGEGRIVCEIKRNSTRFNEVDILELMHASKGRESRQPNGATSAALPEVKEGQAFESGGLPDASIESGYAKSQRHVLD